MSTENPGKRISMLAGADLSTSQFYAVKVSADDTVVLSGDGQDAIGVLQDTPASGQTGAVQLDGVSKAVAGAAIVAGAKVASNGAGKFITAVATKAVIGTAKTAAAGDLSVFEIILDKQGILA